MWWPALPQAGCVEVVCSEVPGEGGQVGDCVEGGDEEGAGGEGEAVAAPVVRHEGGEGAGRRAGRTGGRNPLHLPLRPHQPAGGLGVSCHSCSLYNR